MHAGQRYAGGQHPYSFGYHSTDADGQHAVAKFAFEHAYHGRIRIVISDVAEKRPSDEYKRIEIDGSDAAYFNELLDEQSNFQSGLDETTLDRLSKTNVLAKRARIAAGIAWEAGNGSNETPSQEPEVRNILRECASVIERLTQDLEAEKRTSKAFAETVEGVREALGQESTHYLCMPGDVKELVTAVAICDADGGCHAFKVLERLREQGRR
jgi:hypothetical protein